MERNVNKWSCWLCCVIVIMAICYIYNNNNMYTDGYIYTDFVRDRYYL